MNQSWINMEQVFMLDEWKICLYTIIHFLPHKVMYGPYGHTPWCHHIWPLNNLYRHYCIDLMIWEPNVMWGFLQLRKIDHLLVMDSFSHVNHLQACLNRRVDILVYSEGKWLASKFSLKPTTLMCLRMEVASSSLVLEKWKAFGCVHKIEEPRHFLWDEFSSAPV